MSENSPRESSPATNPRSAEGAAALLEDPAKLREVIRQSGQRAWEEAEQALAGRLRQSLTVAFLGSASSGKDSAIRALFGIDFGEISPIPGSTSELRVSALDAEGQVLLVNAPGFGDVRADVDAVARKAMDALDILLYVVNCEGGATIDERRDLDAIRALGRPVLVCLNKIDLIRPHQREVFIEATLAQLGVERDDAVICAFDPLPQLAPEPIGVSEVAAWITKHLTESGKELLFAKSLRNKALACEPLIAAAAKQAGIAGAIPVPGIDFAAVTAIQVKLIRDIAVVFEVPIDKEVAMFIVGEILSGGMRGATRWATEALKAAGWIPGGQIAEAFIVGVSAMVSSATTFGVGKAAVRWLQSGQKLPTDELRAIFDIASADYRSRYKLIGEQIVGTKLFGK